MKENEERESSNREADADDKEMPWPKSRDGRTMRDGRILFLARDEATAQKSVMNSKRLDNICEIEVQIMDRMNQAQGTIFSRNMITEKEEDILEALKTYRCTKVEQMKAFWGGQRRPNGIHILTFETRELPDNVLCGYERCMRNMLSVWPHEELV
jgi:hypothetical protein